MSTLLTLEGFGGYSQQIGCLLEMLMPGAALPPETPDGLQRGLALVSGSGPRAPGLFRSHIGVADDLDGKCP